MSDEDGETREERTDLSPNPSPTRGGEPADLSPNPSPTRGGESTARRAWEQALLDDYSEHRWHQALDPLAALFAQWSAGAAEHLEVSTGIARAYRQIEADFLFFSDRRATLVALIQQDRAWYEPWLAAHPEPA